PAAMAVSRLSLHDALPIFPESLVWRAIARAGYMTRFVNQVFRVYHDSADSLSRQREGQQHALGLWLLAQDTVVECLPWFRYQPRSEEHTSELQSRENLVCR